MATWIASRPLVTAGTAAVLGALAARHPLAAGTGLGLLLAGLVGLLGPGRAGHRARAVPRAAPLAVPLAASLAVALAASACAFLSAGHAEFRTVRNLRSLEAGRHAAEGPRSGSVILTVERCDEDSFRRRSWAVGRTARGLGVLAAWPGPLPDAIVPGTRIRIAGRFTWPRAAGNPGPTDARRSLAVAGASAFADLRTIDNLEVLARGPPGPGARLASLRRRAARRLCAQLPEDVAPVAAALLLGIRSGLDEDTVRAFERSGTMHLLAISGLHLVLLAGMVHRGARALGGGPRLAAGVTLVLLAAYVPVAGSGAPVRRAATGIACYTLALLRSRPADAPSATGGAALLLALGDPDDVFRVGFRLSFAAVIGIQLLAAFWQERWGRRYRLLRRFPAVRQDRPVRLAVTGYVLRGLPVSLAAWCATAAFVAEAFGSIAPWAPLVNLVAAPLLVPLLPALVVLASGFDAAGPLVVLLVRTLRVVLAGAGALPGALLSLPPVPAFAVLAWCLGLLLLRFRPRLGPGMMLFALAAALPRPARDGCALVLLDVGHGQAVLVRFEDGTDVLVDAGSRGRRDAGRRLVLPALRALGVHRLAAAVCTHDDADHWNALPAVLASMPVDRLVVESRPPSALRAIARERRVRIVPARRGQILHTSARASLEVVAAGESHLLDDNDRSIALLLRVDQDYVLLPADREAAGLDALLDALAARGIGRVDVLVAPHHGARCERADRVAAAIRPRVVLVSTGRGFADQASLRAFGAAHVASTDQRGCLTLAWTGPAPAEVLLSGYLDPPPR